MMKAGRADVSMAASFEFGGARIPQGAVTVRDIAGALQALAACWLELPAAVAPGA